MKQFPNLTLKRVLRRNKEIEKRYPEDRKIHKITEEGNVAGIFPPDLLLKMAYRTLRRFVEYQP